MSFSPETEFYQNVIVMRHGDRRDNFDPTWVKTSDRPWDPPLVDAGLSRAFLAGRDLRHVGFPIHRVFVSPFLRCVQTAAQAISGLCAADDDGPAGSGPIDPFKVKVSIEFGLCETLTMKAIKAESVPKDGDFGFNVSDAEAMLPAQTVDHHAQMIYPEMPKWEETIRAARNRYEHVIQALADKYPSENLLLVTHGECVGALVRTVLKGAAVYEVNYCAYSHARRHITFGENKSFTAENFHLQTAPEKTGILYSVE